MTITETRIADAKILQPALFTDKRGCFQELWNQKAAQEAGIEDVFVQDNLIRSQKGAIRGVHTQKLHPQSKIVTCVSGKIWDVIVDCRPESPSFGQWYGIQLSEENRKQVYVPAGVAHGFLTIEDSSVLMKVSTHYTPEDEIGFIWNDPIIGIQWPVIDESSLIFAEKDKKWTDFETMIKELRK